MQTKLRHRHSSIFSGINRDPGNYNIKNCFDIEILVVIARSYAMMLISLSNAFL